MMELYEWPISFPFGNPGLNIGDFTMFSRLILRLAPFVLLFAACTITLGVSAPDVAHEKKADQVIAKAIAFLKSKQEADGSWNPKTGPGVTAMVISAMLDQPNADPADPVIAKGIAYVLSKQQKDGSIHDGILENYNTSICLSMLAKVGRTPEVRAAIDNARNFLKRTQWTGAVGPDGKATDKAHSFFGGFGYGKHGRPDGSNSQFAVQALIDSGSDCKDPEILAAVEFFSRLQGSKTNKYFGDKIVNDGGAIYATSINKDNIGVAQSFAGETVEEGTTRLRTYGSMTYAMFKTYIHAQLEIEDANDPRIKDALRWIAHNYTLDHNPGMPEERKHEGYYYYFVTFAKALDADPKRKVVTTADGKQHNWANDLIAKLATLQKPDGSFINEADRWLEGDAVVVTTYALTAINAARH